MINRHKSGKRKENKSEKCETDIGSSYGNVWTVYDGKNISLTNEYKNFTKTFQMTEDTDSKTNFTISMGAVTE